MSKRDILAVCTLAAHLASRSPPEWANNPASWGRYADDAMTLQRLARNIRHKAKDIGNVPWGTYLRTMTDKGEVVLKPYGLVGEFSATGIIILGLPGNTLGGDEDGYGI